MNVDVILGLQWGDEGKGKIVDVLTPKYDVIARFQGGPNAGHTLEFEKLKHVLHTIPSGIFHGETTNVIGSGVVIDPIIFKKEIDSLQQVMNQNPGLKQGKLLVSKKAHLIMPTHRILDAASEAAKGKSKIGSTLKGIGPTYMDKTGRNGLRVGDTLRPDFKERYNALIAKHESILKQYDFKYNLADYEAGWMEGVKTLQQFEIIDTEYVINENLRNKQRVLAEGAQGTLLDIDFGSYPFVTSSNTICAGACIGLGVAPNRIGEVIGIFKAYCTRVGSGPFPSELMDEVGEEIRKSGNEFGSTTGRPRRCGWLDLVSLKYSVMLNGVTQLVMTKADVLNDFAEIKIATAYKVKTTDANGNTAWIETDRFPFETDGEIESVYDTLPGWQMDISKLTTEAQFPQTLKDYIKYIEDFLEVPITIVSVGPERDATIMRSPKA